MLEDTKQESSFQHSNSSKQNYISSKADLSAKFHETLIYQQFLESRRSVAPSNLQDRYQFNKVTSRRSILEY